MEKKSKGEDGGSGGGAKRTQIMRDDGAGVASGPFRRRPHHRDRLRRSVACA